MSRTDRKRSADTDHHRAKRAEKDVSEDELDSVSDSPNEEQEANEESNFREEDDKSTENSREAREDQKKLLKERKMKRKSGIEVERIKQLWEKLRVRNPPVPKDVRKKLCDETWKLCEGVIGDLVLKHDASRVVQTLVKFSDRERRDKICKELEPYYYKLATSAYGKYLLIKLLKYGSVKSRALILHSLHGKFRKLLTHREGAYVLDDTFSIYATPEQQQQILREFWGAKYALFEGESDDKRSIEEVCAESPEERRIIARNLGLTIKTSVEKGSTGFQILHAVMQQYVKIFEGDEVRDFIDLLKDQVAEMVHTPQGADVACTILARSNAKERKTILKGLKEFAKPMVKNQYGSMVTQTIFMVIDDTRMVAKTFLPVYTPDFIELLTGKYSRKPFIYLLNGLDRSFFSPRTIKQLNQYVEMSQETSKKPQEKRRIELLDHFIPEFYKAFNKKPYEVLGENMGAQFVLELVMNHDELSNEPSKERAKALQTIIDCVKGNLTKETHLIHSKFTERLLKTLIQGGKWNRKTKQIDSIEGIGLGFEFAKKFADELFDLGEDEDAVKMWLSESGGAFVIVGLVDSFKKHEEDKDAKKFLDQLEQYDEFIKDQPDTNKGARLLEKVMM